MKNPNTGWNKAKAFLKARWLAADFPGGEERFQLVLFVRDLATYMLLPLLAILFSHALNRSEGSERRAPVKHAPEGAFKVDGSKSQVIVFESRSPGGGAPLGRRAPGSLVRLRLLNLVEAYSSIPVQAQIVDAGLGNAYLGGILIGDGATDTNVDRINIAFRLARDPRRDNVALPISARALSLDGTLGIEAFKKEGAFARGVYGSGVKAAGDAQRNVESMDLRSIVIKALTAGLSQEFGAGTQVERNRSEVLSLAPGAEFFAELLDYFPSSGK